MGKSEPDGILQAPASQPQGEVTFEIDSDGTPSVSARKKGIGKETNPALASDNGRLMDNHTECVFDGDLAEGAGACLGGRCRGRGESSTRNEPL